MPKLNTRKKIDLAAVCFLLVAAAFISSVFQIDLIISVFLYLGVPALYLWLREKKNWKKILAASVVLGVFQGMAWNLIAEQANTWVTHYTIYPLNVIFVGKMPLGEFIWGFLILFYTITFYEHFLDKERSRKLSRHATLALGVGMASFFLAACLLVVAPEQVHFEYSYLLMGALILVPLGLLLFVDSKLIFKVFWLSIFFFILNLIFEITAISHGLWNFPGTYIGTVTILTAQFPIEELLFWILFATPSLILCYEVLFDDGK